jgi:hypothetical protein
MKKTKQKTETVNCTSRKDSEANAHLDSKRDAWFAEHNPYQPNSARQQPHYWPHWEPNAEAQQRPLTPKRFQRSKWENCIGDLSVVDRLKNIMAAHGPNASSTPAESHFAMYLRVVQGFMKETSVLDLCLGTMMGIDGKGNEAKKASYWTLCSRGIESNAGRESTSTERRQRESLATWIAYQTTMTGREDHIIKARSDPDDPYYYVKQNTSNFMHASARSEAQQKAELSSRARGLLLLKGVTWEEFEREPSASAMIGKPCPTGGDVADADLEDFNVNDFYKILFPDEIPRKAGYYTVNSKTLQCFLCRDYIHRGCLTQACKHGLGLRKYLDKTFEADMADLRSHLKRREYGNPEQDRNKAYYGGVLHEVIEALTEGQQSHWRTSPASGDVELFDSRLMFVNITAEHVSELMSTCEKSVDLTCANKSKVEVNGWSVIYFKNAVAARALNVMGEDGKQLVGVNLEAHDVLLP